VPHWFDTAYADGGTPTWDLGRPQGAVVRLLDAGAFGPTGAFGPAGGGSASGGAEGAGTAGGGSAVLDAGCGTGEHALLLAERGHRVVGVDLAAEAIGRAAAKAEARGLAAEFHVHDAMDLAALGRTFDVALDVGLFHTLGDEDRPRYAASLAAAVRPGGHAFVLCWSDRNPFGFGPRRITRRELRAAFRAAAGWRVEEIVAEALETRLPTGSVAAWLARLSRVA
jgi:2-polyprenyl-3-methyl-5-hydroxy-6-metoxy-1,4-benzoquinol methylase